jgi:hypothetical protein
MGVQLPIVAAAGSPHVGPAGRRGAGCPRTEFIFRIGNGAHDGQDRVIDVAHLQLDLMRNGPSGKTAYCWRAGLLPPLTIRVWNSGSGVPSSTIVPFAPIGTAISFPSGAMYSSFPSGRQRAEMPPDAETCHGAFAAGKVDIDLMQNRVQSSIW